MIVFDQLKKNDPQLRAVTLVVLGGLGILLVGLWWVQIVSARDYQESLESQSFRTVRIPAVRGSILDCNHRVLAENRPTYNVSLYLEELRGPFENAYSNELRQARAEQARELTEAEQRLGRKLTRLERKDFILNRLKRDRLRETARCEVASNVVLQVSRRLQQPLTINLTNFERHYETRLALPYPILENLDPTNIARFEEQSTSPLGVDLDVQSRRVYPYQTTAAHLLGYLKRNNDSFEGEEAFFSYRLPDFCGELGIEFGYDKELRGTAGSKSVLVNNLGYRQTESIWSPAEPGHNVVLTIDLHIQQVAENALRNVQGPTTRGAVVVMDVRNGDILALASSPTFNPGLFVQPRVPHEEWERISELHAQKNRATQENYAPGSIFKTVVGLAALEAGLNPHEIFQVQPNPELPGKGVIFVRGRRIRDLAPPGPYDFRRALMRSSNSYFITNGLRIGPERIIRLGHKFHLGEKIGLPLNQETAGIFPRQIGLDWTDGKTANLSIGQEPVQVTPLQVAVVMSAIANGGKVLWPRLVDRIEPNDPSSGEQPVVFPNGRVRDELGVSQRSLNILQEAMLADTEDPEGTGKHAVVPGLRICGKTGTAQIQDEHNIGTGQTTWFASFAPYESPRWAVVVMVEDGASGGGTCSPVARPIYAALLERDRLRPAKGETMAKAN